MRHCHPFLSWGFGFRVGVWGYRRIRGHNYGIYRVLYGERRGIRGHNFRIYTDRGFRVTKIRGLE